MKTVYQDSVKVQGIPLWISAMGLVWFYELLIKTEASRRHR